MNILVTRTDRMGDVILATPTLKALREHFPESKITFLVRKEWQPILNYGVDIRLMTYDPDESRGSLTARLKKEKFDRVYILRDDSKVSFAAFHARIPERIGPKSTLRSFFLFNRGHIQKRSRCELHEAEYNLDLAGIHRFGNEQLPQAWVRTEASAKSSAEQFLKLNGLTSKKFIVIHPGSSGSARYVKQQALIDFVQKWKAEVGDVVVSGGSLESETLDAFSHAVPGVKVLRGDLLGLGAVAEVFREAKALVAHGTGPLHLAAAVGTPVLAIFPPLFVLSEKRWGPLVEKREVWVPEVNCPEKYRCRGQRCALYDCMDLFEIQQQVAKLKELIR